MDKGERWAYEVPKKYNLTEVLVEKIGTKRPLRVLISYLDDEYEGASEWVPPNRLKVLWANVDVYRAREKAWEELRHDGDEPTEIEGFAVEHVLYRRLPPAVATRLLNHGNYGLLAVHDWPELEVFTGRRREELLSGTHLEEEGTAYCSWKTTLAVAQAYAQLHAAEMLRELETYEKAQLHETVHGRLERRQGRDYFTEPEYSAEWYDGYTAPMLEIIRGWCGEARVERDEINELRRELWRNTERVNRAIHYLLLNDDEPRAWSLHSEMYPDAVRKRWKSQHHVQREKDERQKRDQEAAAELASQRMHERRVELDAKLERDRADALGYEPPPWAAADR